MAAGAAIARGLLKGLGLGAQEVAREKRKDEREQKRQESAFKTFRKQQDYLAEKQAIVTQELRTYQELQTERTHQENLKLEKLRQSNRLVIENRRAANMLKANKEQIMLKAHQAAFERELEVGKNFTQLAKKTPAQLAAIKAHNFAKNFPKAEYGKMYQLSMKQDAGKDKALLVKELDGAQPDYSRFENIPEFKDAIPRKLSVTGVDMGEQFQYDPELAQAAASEQLTKLTEGDKKRKQTTDIVQTQFQVETGIPLARSVSTHVAGMFPNGQILNAQGENKASLVINGMIQAGELMRTADGYMFTKDVVAQRQAEEIQKAQMARAGLQTTPEGEVGMTMEFEEPQAPEAQLRAEAFVSPEAEEKKTKAATKEQEAKTKDVIKTLNKDEHLSSLSLVNDISKELQGLSEDVFGLGLSTFGAPDVVRNTLAAVGSDTAAEAKDFVSKLATFRNELRNSLFGATLTAGEKEAFDQMIEEMGTTTTREGLQSQLTNLNQLIAGKVSSILTEADDATVEEVIRRNPTARDVYINQKMKEFNVPEERRQEVVAYVNKELGIE